MKDLIASAVQYGPRYFEDLFSLITRPKQRLLSLLQQDETSGRAITFFIISLVLSFILIVLPLRPVEEEIPFMAAELTAFRLIVVFVNALIYFFSFAIVGGKGDPLSFVTLTFYISAVFFLIGAIFIAAGKGILIATAPDMLPLFQRLVTRQMINPFRVISDEELNDILVLTKHALIPLIIASVLTWCGGIIALAWANWELGCIPTDLRRITY